MKLRDVRSLASRTNDEVGHRFFVPSASELFEGLHTHAVTLDEAEPRRREAVYFDDERLSLPMFDRARAIRALEPGERPARYLIEVKMPSPEGPYRAMVPMSLDDAAGAFAEVLGLENLGPRFAVQWKRRTFLAKDGSLALELDSDVCYFTFEHGELIPIGRESSPRVRVVAEDDHELARAIASLRRLPRLSKRWTGYHHLMTRALAHYTSERPGWEYKVALDVDRFDDMPDALPFPIRDRHQTQYVRDGHDPRLMFFGTRAIYSPIAVGRSIGGVLKRRKIPELHRSAWDIADPVSPIRITERVLIAENPASGRAYTIALRRGKRGEEEARRIDIAYAGVATAARDATTDAESAIVDDIRTLRDALAWRYAAASA